jgi:hypothetical protein
VEAAGIEPASEIDATDSTASVCENQQPPRAANALHGSDANCLSLSLADSDLHFLITIWSGLSVEVREALVALAKSSAHGAVAGSALHS